MDPECPESLQEIALICLATLCGSVMLVDMLQKRGVLVSLLKDLTLDTSMRKDLRVIHAAIMSNMCKGVHVSYEGCDASDECIMLLNKLSDGILEETCKEVLDQRICGALSFANERRRYRTSDDSSSRNWERLGSSDYRL